MFIQAENVLVVVVLVGDFTEGGLTLTNEHKLCSYGHEHLEKQRQTQTVQSKLIRSLISKCHEIKP